MSHSQVDTLLQCGEKFRLQRVLKAPEVPAFWFSGGSAVHSATEELDLHMWETGELWSDLQCETAFGRIFGEEIEESKAVEPDVSKWAVGGRGKEDMDWWYVQGAEMVKRWKRWCWEDDNPLSIWTLPNGEPAIEVSLMHLFGGVPVKMGIDRIMQDRITGELIVVDLKCGAREPVAGYQLPLYTEAARRAFGVDITYGAYWLSRKGTLTLPKDLRPMIADLDNRFEKARKMVDAEIFLAVPSSFCSSCSVREFCSAQGGSTDLLFGRTVAS